MKPELVAGCGILKAYCILDPHIKGALLAFCWFEFQTVNVGQPK